MSGTTNEAKEETEHENNHEEYERRQSCRTQRYFSSPLFESPHSPFPQHGSLPADAHVRESWVRAMEARIVRDQLQSCYRAEGVNHYESCRELSEKYTTLLKENRV
ncbi:hypothetical protein H4582DRAFT_1981302, partial [Lactarius indigo]